MSEQEINELKRKINGSQKAIEDYDRTIEDGRTHYTRTVEYFNPLRAAEKATLAKLKAKLAEAEKQPAKLKPEDIENGSFGVTGTGEGWIAYHWSGLDTPSVVLEGGKGFDHPIDFLTSYPDATISGNIFKLMKQGPNIIGLSNKCRDFFMDMGYCSVLGKEFHNKLKACKESRK